MKFTDKVLFLKAEEKGIPIVRLARELSYSRTNMYKIFSKKSIDTDVLVRLSNILDFDFFGLYSKHLDKMKKCCTPDGARTR